MAIDNTNRGLAVDLFAKSMGYARQDGYQVIDRGDGDGVVLEWNRQEPEPTDAELQAVLDAHTDKASDSASKKTGVLILNVMCSATSDDQNGLLAVAYAHDLDPTNFEPTRFEFSNGATLEIDKDNFPTVLTTWMGFRQSFFTVQV